MIKDGAYQHQNEVTSPKLAECLAMRRAIQFARQKTTSASSWHLTVYL
jgi:hypothetical protein